MLDIGCGNGEFQHILAPLYPNSHFTAADVSDTLIEKARMLNSSHPNVIFQVQDCTKLPDCWTEKFDLVTVAETLHDLPFPTKSLREIQRVLKPGGVISIIDINSDSDLSEQAKDPLGSMSLYAFSLYHCLSSSLAVEGSEGLGTCVGRQKLTGLVERADYMDVTVMDIPNMGFCFHIIANKCK